MPLLIKNGEIITADSAFTGDVWCEGETITSIGAGIDAPPGAEVIDAAASSCFRASFDPHVHIYLPFMGTYAKDTYETASRAALVGGTTTADRDGLPRPRRRPARSIRAVEVARRRKIGLRLHVSHGGHRLRREAGRTAEAHRRRRTASFKVFLAYKGALESTTANCSTRSSWRRELGVIVTAHCENAELVAQMQAGCWPPAVPARSGMSVRGRRASKRRAWSIWRAFRRMTGAHVYVVHTSCADALQAAERARERGVRPMGGKRHSALRARSQLRRARRRPEIRYVPAAAGTASSRRVVGRLGRPADRHGRDRSCAVRFRHAKADGEGRFHQDPQRIPSVEDRVHLLYTHGVAAGRIDVHRFVDAASTKAAQLFGLFPRKGTIQPGADADLVIFDPAYEGTISAARQQMNVDYSAFEGWPIRGRAETVAVRGRVQVRVGKVRRRKRLWAVLAATADAPRVTEE